MLKEVLVLADVCFHAPNHLGIGGATCPFWVHRGPSCSLVQAGLGCDGNGWGRGEWAGGRERQIIH